LLAASGSAPFLERCERSGKPVIGDQVDSSDHRTVSREVAHNGGRSKYRATAATNATVERAKRPKDLKLYAGTVLGDLVRSKLETAWSPEQISAWLRIEHPDCDEMRISHESIYVAMYTSTASMTAKHLTCLRQGRKRRRPPR
jgi:IS30 family transposase